MNQRAWESRIPPLVQKILVMQLGFCVYPSKSLKSQKQQGDVVQLFYLPPKYIKFSVLCLVFIAVLKLYYQLFLLFTGRPYCGVLHHINGNSSGISSFNCLKPVIHHDMILSNYLSSVKVKYKGHPMTFYFVQQRLIWRTVPANWCASIAGCASTYIAFHTSLFLALPELKHLDSFYVFTNTEQAPCFIVTDWNS